jgi:predicted glycosyltransferase
MSGPYKKKIWIDLDNSPHVLFFNPIIKELKKRGYGVVVTARNYAQVIGLADLFNIKYTRIGRHYGKNKYLKAIGVLIRSLQMLKVIYNEKPDLAFNHGSRSQIISAKMAGLFAAVAIDYEHTQSLPFLRRDMVIMPEILLKNGVKRKSKKMFGYPGIKEDVYVPDFVPDSTFLKSLNIGHKDLLVTIRPPATLAHYRNSKSNELFEAVIELLASKHNIRIIILPRTEMQGVEIRDTWSEYFNNGKITIPDQVVNGLDLIWYSDLVISGGGTMNREAAALGVPVYSIFKGKIGAVDQYLSESGRLTLLESVEDVYNKIALDKRHRPDKPESSHSMALQKIVDEVTELAGSSK